MSATVNSEIIKDSPWSILEGNFEPDSLTDYRAEVESIEKKVYQNWNRGDIANRIIVADIVELAVITCQPQLFNGRNPDREKEIRKDIGTSAFASYSYTNAQIDQLANLVADITTTRIPILEALETILLQSAIFLGEGRDLTATSHATVLHLLAKQIGRSAELPKAAYNRD